MQGLRRYRVGLALVVLAVVLGFLVFYRLKDQQARAVQRPRGDTLVGVILPTRRDLEVRFATTADIQASQQAAVFSKVSGYIRRVHADRGDFVKEGQLLAEIDDQELQAQVEQARAGLLTGQASHQMARSTLDRNRANLENQRANLVKARAVAAVIGGLAVSTVFPLILIPTLYVMVETRFPRRVETRELSLTPQGESA